MVKVPTWDQNVSDLPGASKTPFATPEAFGSEIGTAQASAGKAIAGGLETLGGALTQQFDEQEALKGKSILSDHEAAVTAYRTQLERDTPPDQVSTIPKAVQDFATQDWNTRRQGVSGKFQNQADTTAHVYHNNVNTQLNTQTLANKDKYTELQIDGTVEKQNSALMANPGQLDGAMGIVNTSVDETNLNPFVKRQLKIKYGTQLYDSVNKGYVERMKNEPLNTALADEAEAFRKNGAAQISKGLNIQDLPQTTPGGAVNGNRVKQIDKTSAGPVIDKVATQTGVDPAGMKVTASIESSGNPNAVTGKYKGLFQLSDSEFNKYVPGGNIFDPEQNAYAAARKKIDEDAEFTKANGRPPTLTESYMQHQQGVAGAAQHMANPDRPAWQNMLATGEGKQKGEAWAKKAIWGNVPDDMKKQFGSVENITSRDFIAMWDKKVSGGAGVTDFKGPVRPDHLAEADKALTMTPLERDLYRTHLKNLYGPGGVDNPPDIKNPQGSRSTLFVTTATIDDKVYLIPTVKDGHILSTDEAIAAAKKDGLEKLPSYKTVDEAQKRYDAMHAFMEKDTGDYFAAKRGETRMVSQPTVKPGTGTTTTGGTTSRPVVIQNAQGNSFVIPTVSSDGSKVLSDSGAVAQFQQTGQHIGVFDQSSAANDYADRLTRVEQRAAVPRTADITQAAPMLGETPKEMQARQDHWDTQFRAVETYRKQIQDQAKKRANDDLGQEESSIKVHGSAGVNPTWTPQALAMVLGPRDAEVALDKREANLKFNAATSGWTPMTDPVQMSNDLETLNPKNVNPQSAAFTQWGKNYEEARALMVKTMESRDKMTKLKGDLEMKKLIDASRDGQVTTDMIDAAKPWLSHTELSAAYVLRDQPPVQRNDTATIEIENSVRTMPPGEFQKYIMGWVAKNNVGKDDLKSYVERNEAYWAQGVQTPMVDAKKWLEDKMTPGMSGIEGSIMRGSMADARVELDDWANNPLNKEKLKDRAIVMQQTRDIYDRYRMEGLKQVRLGLPLSPYFPPGTHPENVDAAVIADAKAKLALDMQKTNDQGQRLMSEAEAQTRWQNIKAWQDSMTDAQRGVKPQPQQPKPEQPKKMSAQIAPVETPGPQFGSQAGQAADTIEQPPQGNGYDRNAIKPEDVMRTRNATDLQENI
jgi:hypothetical protein